ncbi:hypothetical protein AAIH56_34300, partial [Pseudomonas aeruginosa]|uniref:hypothetical protein n=1 Tax=Pseudomonas aeruginosa TaxID=287 RepID=UPI0031B7D23C
MPFSAATDAENNNACSLYTTKVNMSLFPVIVVFGLSFPPIFFELLLSLAIFWLVSAGPEQFLFI